MNRDDLEALVNCLICFINGGKLPWTGVVSKEEAMRLKKTVTVAKVRIRRIDARLMHRMMEDDSQETHSCVENCTFLNTRNAILRRALHPF